MKEFVIYTDGAYSMLKNEGAFAYVILDSNGIVIKKRAYKCINETNNRMELKAIIAALYNLPNKDEKVNVLVVSDSQYALCTLCGTWRRKLNQDLFDVYERIMKEREIEIEWKWVKGHNGDFYNEMCDEMCNQVLGYDANEEYAKYKRIKEKKDKNTCNNKTKPLIL